MRPLTEYGKLVVSRYQYALPILLTTAIPFTGAASQVLANLVTPDVDEDVLLLDANVDFLNAGVTLQIQDSGGYFWNEVSTPIHAVAGASSQVMPILPLPIEYLLLAHAKLRLRFVNAAASPESVTRNITWRGLRLKNKIA